MSKTLSEGAQYVHYELQTLIYSLRANSKAWAQLEREQAENRRELWRAFVTATLESFLVHYRNLKSFLNNKTISESDDVLARNFSDTWIGSSYVVGTADEDERLNRLLSHISYSRERLQRGQWDCCSMEDRICAAFEQFLRTVLPEHVQLFQRCTEELIYRSESKLVGKVSSSTATMVTWRW